MDSRAKVNMSEGDESIQIREVLNDNLEAEFSLIRDIVDAYPYITIHTAFPGIVFRPCSTWKTASKNNYQILKANVDVLKLLQVGLTFSDEHGNLPTFGTDGKHCIWQFNFREFDVSKDPSSTESIEFLRDNGIDFKKNSRHGIEYSRFAELVMSSGIVLNEDMKWVAFHGGFDFGFLLKLLTGKSSLPDTEKEFLQLIKIYFKNVSDVKHMMKLCEGLHGDLNKVAELLDVERVGIYQQAGSNSLLTYGIFSKLKELFFNDSTEKYAGILFGLGGDNDEVGSCWLVHEGPKLMKWSAVLSHLNPSSPFSAHCFFNYIRSPSLHTKRECFYKTLSKDKTRRRAQTDDKAKVEKKRWEQETKVGDKDFQFVWCRPTQVSLCSLFSQIALSTFLCKNLKKWTRCWCRRIPASHVRVDGLSQSHNHA